MKQNATISPKQDAAVTISNLSSPTALQGFLEAAPDAIVVVDTDGRIAIVNQLTERMFGYTRDELPAVVPSKIPTPSDIELAGIQVLLVDDQADARESVGAILRMFGAEVITVASAADAIAALDNMRPNVLLADIAMPGEDGYELIRKIRTAAEPERRSLAAAALTAYSSTEDRLRVLSAGYQVHVPKPADPGELVSAVSRLAKDVSEAARTAVEQREQA